jgi:trk system potassium uptake protein TrkA
MDLFLALTNDDEDNIMAALLAKRMGARRVVALINRRAYADLVQGGPDRHRHLAGADLIGTLLAHVRRGDVAAVHSLRRGAAEALELVVHGDASPPRWSAAASRRSACPRAPPSAPSCARPAEGAAGVHRGPGQRAPVQGDHGAPRHGDRGRGPRHRLLSRKKLVPKVEKLFQVGFGFL